MTGNNKQKIPFVILLVLITAGCIFMINRDLFHFESIHLTGRSFSDKSDLKGLYRLTAPETLKRGTYSMEFVTRSPSPDERWVILSGDDIVQEGLLDGPVSFTVEKSSEQISAGVIYGGNNPDFYVEEINYYSDHVLTRDSLLYHLSLSCLTAGIMLWVLFRLCFPARFQNGPGRFLTPSRERLLLLFLLLSVLICIPYYRPEYVKGDDSTYHMARIEGLKTTLEQGIFPPRIYLFYLNGYGYPGGIFYPDLLLYFPALLRLLGFGFILTYKIYIFTLNYLTLLSMYFCVSRICGRRMPGIIAAILYGFNAYRLIDVYYRGAVGELQAFIFIPLIVLGLYYIFTGETGRRWILTAGCTGLALSHLISTVLCAVLMIIFFLLNIRRIFRDRKIFTSLLISFITTFGLCAYFLLPLAEQFLTNEVITSSTVNGGIPLYALFTNNTVWMPPVKPYPGYPLLFGSLVFLLPRRNSRTLDRTAAFLIFLSVLGFFCSTDLFPWKLFPGFNLNIQFPWRFFTLSIPLLIIAETVIFGSVFPEPELRLMSVIFAAFCMISVIPIYKSAITSRWMESRGYKLENNRVGSYMYLPIGFEPDFIDKNRDTVLSSDKNFNMLSHKRGNLNFRFGFEVQDDPVEFEIPLLYYTGYRAELTTDSGTKSLLTSRGPHGMVSVTVKDADTGSIFVRYVKTAAQHAGDALTILTVLLACLFTILPKRKPAPAACKAKQPAESTGAVLGRSPDQPGADNDFGKNTVFDPAPCAAASQESKTISNSRNHNA